MGQQQVDLSSRPGSPKVDDEDADLAIEIQVRVVLQSGSASVVKLEKSSSKPGTVYALRSKFIEKQPLPLGKAYKFLRGEAILGLQDLLEDGDLITAVAIDSPTSLRWPPVQGEANTASFVSSIKALNLHPLRAAPRVHRPPAVV